MRLWTGLGAVLLVGSTLSGPTLCAQAGAPVPHGPVKNPQHQDAAARASVRGRVKPEVRGVHPMLTTLMYLVNQPASIASFREHARQISIVAPQSFNMDAEGFVSGEAPAEVVAIAAANHVAVMPLVVNRGFNQPLMHTVLDSAESRARAIRYLLYYALRDGYIGFQFDYENIHWDYQNRFTLFFREAAREFHGHGLQMSIAVVGKSTDVYRPDAPGGFENWSGVYDYAALGKAADFVSVMAYPEHAGFSGPGPMAGLPWVRQIADYSLSKVPGRKLSLGLPLYGFQWTAAGDATASGDGKTPAKWTGHSAKYSELAPRLADKSVQWDEAQQASHASFDEAGVHKEIWFEDARSLDAKLKLASELHLEGVSGWVLGAEDPAFWKALEQYGIRHPRAPVISGSVDERARAAAKRMQK